MRLFLVLIIAWVANLHVHAQSNLGFQVSLEELEWKGHPRVHSYAYGTQAGKWLILGGRTDGLHRRQAWAAFDPSGNNPEIHVVDPVAKKVWSQSVKNFSNPLREQLLSTNICFYQKGEDLILVGGYGFSSKAENFETFPLLTVVSIPKLMEAVMNGKPAENLFHSVENPKFQVTGGQIVELGGWLFITGGQHFSGHYNPMGPNHAMGFFQAYTNEIRGFKYAMQQDQVKVEFGKTFRDTALLHRRDYNVVPQVMENGKLGVVLFSGVFQYDANIPWLNCVAFDGEEYAEIPGFEQLLSQYQCARLPIYDAKHNQMHTFFFGGMGRYVPIEPSGLLDDVNVPFVKTISRVSRFASGHWGEFDTKMRMPGYLGAAAEFIPANNTLYKDDILSLNALPKEKTLVGYIVAGLESKQPNTLFEMKTNLSWASNRVIAVYVTPTN